MTTHTFIAPNESAIDQLTTAYGTRLELLDEKHKLFIAGALILYLYGLYSLEGAIDELDPEAEYPESFVSLVEALEQQSRHDLLSMIGAIATQLAWPKA
jgi:hypothetical protein